MEWLAIAHIKDRGQPCTVTDASGGTTESFMLLKKVGTRTDLKYIENFKEGLILAESGLVSGDLLDVDAGGTGTAKHLVITSQVDQATQQIAFQAVKINTTLEIQRQQETRDDNGNITGQVWVVIATDIPAYAGPSFSRMFQEDPGMVPAQTFQAIFRTGYDVQLLDRVVFSGIKCQVDFIDPLSSPGNYMLDVSNDTRT